MNKEFLNKNFLKVLEELKNLKELKKLNELNELNKEIQKSRNKPNVKELRSKLPKLKESIKENLIIYKEKKYKFKSQDDIIVYCNIYDDNINDSYDLAIKSPVTADNNNLYLDIYNEINKNDIKKEIDKKYEENENKKEEILQEMNTESLKIRPEIEVIIAQNLIDNIKEDDYKDFRILNALKNLIEVAKILISLKIENDDGKSYILDNNNNKYYIFHDNSLLKDYNSSIYKLKTSIDYIESGQTLEKKNAIYIIRIFRELVSPNKLYEDVLKSVKDKVAKAALCKAYAAKEAKAKEEEEAVVEYEDDEKKEGGEEIKNLIEVAKILISLKIENDDGAGDGEGESESESEKSESYIVYNNIKYKFHYKEKLKKYKSSINELITSIDDYIKSEQTFKKNNANDIRSIFSKLASPISSSTYSFASYNQLHEDVLESVKDKVEKEAFCKAYAAEEAAKAVAGQSGGKRKSKGKSKKVSKKPVVSQKKQSIYKEIFGKQMKIYKMPDSRKEYVKYKGELLHISDYKDLMKQKAKPKTKTKVTKVTKVTQQKSKSKAKAKSKTKK